MTRLSDWTELNILYMYQNPCIHSSVDGHLGCFHVLAIVNSTAVNIGVQVSFSILVSSGHMASSAITGSYDGFGEGSGTLLQYSCLENPMDGGAWWLHGVAKSRT